VESFHRAYGLPVTILRPFNTYGPRQSLRAVIPTIISQALRSLTVRLGSLEPRRDLTFVRDTARGFYSAATAPGAAGETIQLGSGKETSVAELVELTGRMIGKKLKVVVERGRKRPPASEVMRLCASNERAREILGWEPVVGLEAGLQLTIDWFRNRADSYKRSLYHI
jgi:nucleoside-diphosphate-sugar epimerase